MERKIKVLHILDELNSGGAERVLFNYYNCIDKSKMQWDFVITAGDNHVTGMLEQPLKEMGSKIYYVPRKRKNLIKHVKAIGSIIKNDHYDVVHAHIDEISAFYMAYAKRYGVKVRITHSHLSKAYRGLEVEIICAFLKPIVRICSNYWFACGIEAGKSLWGDKAVKSGKVKVINNAIDTEKFAFDSAVRNKVRKKLNLEDKLVVGSVGRFSYQKNSDYLINIFNEVCKQNDNSMLVLVGGGNLEEKMREMVRNYGLGDKVLFLGIRSDVYEIMQAMDVFILPSRFEGLPIVLVEAQCSGLPCLVSNNVTREIAVTDFITYISLDETLEKWAQEICQKADHQHNRSLGQKQIEEAGYKINIEAQKLQDFYLNAVNE